MPSQVQIPRTLSLIHILPQQLDSPSRAKFFADCKPGGKYDGVVGIYRNNLSIGYIDVFDKELVEHLPSSLKWIAHQGAGYDKVDVEACKARGELSTTSTSVGIGC